MNQQVDPKLDLKNELEGQYDSELFFKTFLKPIQITLKKSKNLSHTLPIGLQQIISKEKEKIQTNKKQKKNFDPIPLPNGNRIFQASNLLRYNNMISLIKGVNQDKSEMKLAICICMYNESKIDLKRTLSGVKNNIKNFVNNGIRSDQIVVCVILDGIEATDPSISEIMQEYEKKSGIYFSDGNKDLHQDLYDDQEEGYKNIGNFILGNQFQDFKLRRFQSRKQEYQKAKKLISVIQELESQKNLNYDSLDKQVQQDFIKVAKKKHKQLHGWDQQKIDEKSNDFYIKRYGFDPKVCRPIIREALSQLKLQYSRYLGAREQIALLHCFREDIQLFQDVKMYSKMNLMFITKYKNRGKIDSHNWFLNGVCRELNPQYSILLDVGIIPEEDALYKMISHMEQHQRVGGVCGFMGLKVQKINPQQEINRQIIDCITYICLKLFSVQRAQQFEYHFAHLVDKPFQSLFKFIHVLPGAFSAYRMNALQSKNDEEESKVLRNYFHSVNHDNISQQLLEFSVCQTISMIILPQFLYNLCYNSKVDDQQLLQNSNVYLAEDRILCMGIYQQGYKLAYLPDAYANVDSMKSLHTLLGQRRRWINGTFFAFSRTKQIIQNSNHKSCWLKFQFLYLTIINSLVFIAPALFLFTVHNAINIFNQDYFIPNIEKLLSLQQDALKGNEILTGIIDFIYVLLFLGLILKSMYFTSKQKSYQTLAYGASTAYGIISLISAGLLIDALFKIYLQDENSDMNRYIMIANLIKYTVIGIIGLYLLAVLVFLILFKRWNIMIDIIFSTFSLLFYLASYLNIFNIYALCRIDDISWGTKGKDADVDNTQNIKAINWKKIKILYVSKYVIYNCFLGFVLIKVGTFSRQTQLMATLVIMGILSIIALIKVILGIIYLLIYKCCTKRGSGGQIDINDGINDIFQPISKLLYRELKKAINRNRNKRDISNIEEFQIEASQFQMMRQSRLYLPGFSKKSMYIEKAKAVQKKSQINEFSTNQVDRSYLPELPKKSSIQIEKVQNKQCANLSMESSHGLNSENIQ